MGKYDYQKDEIVGIFKILERTDKRSGGHWYFKVQCTKCGFITDMQSQCITRAKKCTHLNKNGNYKNFCSYYWKNKRLGKIFKEMTSRCYDKNTREYRWYGEKGIKICDEWINNPQLFQDWALNNGYKDNLTIDRINSDKDYSPDNCRWITLNDNAKYKSTTTILEVDGEYHTGSDWARLLNLGQSTINMYLRKYDEEIVKDFIRARRKDMNRYRPSKTTWLEVYDIM